MALPLAPAPVTEGAPQPDPGVDAPAAGGWMPAFTIMKNAETGEFALITGDEPEEMGEGEGGDPAGPKFPDGPALLRALMGQIEGNEGDTMKAGFNEGFDKGAMANDKRPMMDMPRGG